MPDAMKETPQQQKEAPNISNEAVQIVMVVKLKEMLENAFHVLPPAAESKSDGKNETIMINNTLSLDDISTKVDAETREAMTFPS